MKKVRGILLVILLALTVISMYSVSGTYAKYTSEGTATGAAKIAKWEVQAKKSDGTFATLTSTPIEIDIFSEEVLELSDSGNGDLKKDASGNITKEIDTDVFAGTCTNDIYKTKATCEANNETWTANTTTIIAPGTGGIITLPTIKNNSEVTMRYKISIGRPSSLPATDVTTLPIELSTDNRNWTAIDSFADTSYKTLDIGAEETNPTKIYWRWKFGTTQAEDNADTALGEDTVAATDAKTTFTIEAKIIAEQVN